MAGHAPGMSGPGPPAEPAEDYAGLFALERDRLSELLAGLEGADWERPSPCNRHDPGARPGARRVAGIFLS